ncbi:MAG: MFS transporter [Promethearchaeota archaeon]
MGESFSPRELKGKKLYGYVFGNFGLMLAGMIAGSYSFIYYTYTINLDPAYSAIGSSLSAFTGAICSIIFGVIIDNKKPGKFGKRRPFILYGLPVWIVTMIMIWTPPLPPPSEHTVIWWPTIIYSWTLGVIRSISGTMIGIAMMSMLPEQSQTLKNREKVAEVQGILMIINSVFSIGIPMVLQSIIDRDNSKYWESSGPFVISFIITVSSILTVIGTIMLIFMFFTVDENFHKNGKFEKKSVINTFKQTFIPLKDKEYRKFLGMRIFNSIGGTMVGMMVIPFVTYVLGRGKTTEQASFLFVFYPFLSMTTKFLWLWIWKLIHKRTGRDIMKTYKRCMTVYVLSAAGECVFFFVYSFEITLILFYLIYGLFLGTMFSMNLFSPPLMNAIIDDGARKFALEMSKEKNIRYDQVVSQISGAYYGLLNFSFSISGAVTIFVVGFIFSGNEHNYFVINSIFVSMSFFFFLSWILLRTIKTKLTRNEWDSGKIESKL